MVCSPQAIKCRLCDLPPVGAEWTVAALDRLVELMPADGLRVLEVTIDYYFGNT